MIASGTRGGRRPPRNARGRVARASTELYVIGPERRRGDSRPAATSELQRRDRNNGAGHNKALPDRCASRRHAAIDVLNSQAFVRDPHWNNGTFILEDGRKTRPTEGCVHPGR